MGALAIEQVHTPALPVVNVASVPKRSPFRYPGGKTWLVPQIRRWLRAYDAPPSVLIEPFAGGGIVTLTAVFENLVRGAVMVELDAEIASVWHTILNGHGEWLANHIAQFSFSEESVRAALSRTPAELHDRAFNTILRNRISRGGILAPGAGIVKNGENGRGLASRWYPATLRRRILDIVALRHKISFLAGDGLAFLSDCSSHKDAVFFIDPPYVVAGRRLYMHSDIDHSELFAVAARLAGDFLMTYDSAPEILALAKRHSFQVCEIPMKSTHHIHKTELLISRDLGWMGAT